MKGRFKKLVLCCAVLLGLMSSVTAQAAGNGRQAGRFELEDMLRVHDIILREGGYFAPGTQAPDVLSDMFCNYTGALDSYWKQGETATDNIVYVPYDEFMAAVRQTIANPGDMKNCSHHLVKGYDAATDMMKIDTMGDQFGDDDHIEIVEFTQTGTTYRVYGKWYELISLEQTAGLIEGVDFVKKQDIFTGEMEYWRFGDKVKLTLVEEDGFLKISGYEKVNAFPDVDAYTIKDGVLTFDNPELGERYLVSFDLDTNILKYEGIAGGGGDATEIWNETTQKVDTYVHTGFMSSFFLEPADGYGIETVEVVPASAGTVTRIDGPKGNVVGVDLTAPATLKVRTTDHAEVPSDTETGITVTGPGDQLNNFSELKLVAESEDISSQKDVILAAIGAEDALLKAYEIHLEKVGGSNDGEIVQPEGNVTVTIPIPEGWDASRTAVFYVADDGTVTDMKGTVSADGKTISFETNHFSTYVLAQMPVKTDEGAGNGQSGNNQPENVQPGKGGVPQTGDTSMVFVWITLLALSVIVVCANRYRVRK